jgi:serine protease Do
MVRRVLPQLLATGRVTRGWLGIQIQGLTEDLARSFGLSEDDGVLVAGVMPDSPAAMGGIRPGDVILEFEGRKTPEVPDLQRAVAETPPLKAARVTVFRAGRRETLEVKIGEMPVDEPQMASSDTERWGVSVQPITPELARQFNLATSEGVLVSEVEEDSPAARAGIRPGDAILEVDRRRVQDVGQFEQLLGQQGTDALLFVQREGRSRYVVMKAEGR